MVDHAKISLWFTGPGFAVDLTVEVGHDVLYQVWEGWIEYAWRVRGGLVVVTADNKLVWALP